jgi:hypothetical protein
MTPDIWTAICRLHLGRDPNPAEEVAMAGQAERAARRIGGWSTGSDNPLFAVEPAHWVVAMRERAKP